jgi:hypothetical protein
MYLGLGKHIYETCYESIEITEQTVALLEKRKCSNLCGE